MIPSPLPPDPPVVIVASDPAPEGDPHDLVHEEHRAVHEEHARHHEALHEEIAALRAELAAAREAAVTPVEEAPTQVEEAPAAAADTAGDVIALPAEAVETIPEKRDNEGRRPKRRRHAY